MKKSRKGITLLTVVLVTVLSLACVFVGCDKNTSQGESTVQETKTPAIEEDKTTNYTSAYKLSTDGVSEETEKQMIIDFFNSDTIEKESYYPDGNPFVCSFGQFGGTIVVGVYIPSNWGLGPDPGKDLIAGEVFVYDDGSILVWKDGKFVSFIDAYLLGYFTDEQIASIGAKYRQKWPGRYECRVGAKYTRRTGGIYDSFENPMELRTTIYGDAIDLIRTEYKNQNITERNTSSDDIFLTKVISDKAALDNALIAPPQEIDFDKQIVVLVFYTCRHSKTDDYTVHNVHLDGLEKANAVIGIVNGIVGSTTSQPKQKCLAIVLDKSDGKKDFTGEITSIKVKFAGHDLGDI